MKGDGKNVPVVFIVGAYPDFPDVSLSVAEYVLVIVVPAGVVVAYEAETPASIAAAVAISRRVDTF